MWREFRADCAKTGNVPFQAPESFQVKWEKDLDPLTVVDEPVVGIEGEIIVTLSDGTIMALDNTGEQLWNVKSLHNARGPAVSAEGVIYVPQVGRINAISKKGKISWTRDITGNPTPVSIHPKSQTIAVGSYSTDWMGTYFIGADGTAISDTLVKTPFNLEHHGRGARITPVALSTSTQNSYIAIRTFDTQTWHEEDGPEPAHLYESIALDVDRKVFWQEKSSTFSLWGECGVAINPFLRDPALESVLYLLDHAIYVFHQNNTFTSILNTFDLFAEDVPESVALTEMVPFQSDLCILDAPAFEPKGGSFIYRVAKKVEQAPTEETTFPPPEVHDLPCFITVNWINQSQGKKPFSVDLWYQPYTSAPATDKAGTIFMGISGGIATITPDGEKNDFTLTKSRDPVEKLILCSEDAVACVTRSGKLIFAEKK